MASTEPAVTGLPPTEVDQKIDPSIATAITTGAPEHVADASGTSAAPAYTTAPAVGEASSGPVSAGPEKAAEQPPATTTTTTTIITTTTGPTSPEGSQIATAPTSPVVGGDAGATNLTAAALPATGDASTTSAAEVPPTANGSAHPTAVNGTEAAVAGAAGAGAVGAGAAAAAAQKEKEPEMVMKPKEAKKYTKLLKKEAKNDEQDLAKAIKDAQNLEKPLRKANKAEKKSEKRHQSAVHDEHKASKELNKAKLAFEKADAALKKALDELDIKKKHTAATNEAYENAKKRIDELRNAKIANDKERARRQASITTAV